jgi:hypothetical protein
MLITLEIRTEKHAGLRGNVPIIFLKFKTKFIKTIIEECQYEI